MRPSSRRGGPGMAVAAAGDRFVHRQATGPLSWLNSTGHERALQLFMVIVLAHWAEHLLQAFQIYGLGWPVSESRGALGHFYPWLVKSEMLHYAYALVMLVALFALRSGFTGTDRKWWTIALA